MDLVREEGCWLIERLWVSLPGSSGWKRGPFADAAAIDRGMEVAFFLRPLHVMVDSS